MPLYLTISRGPRADLAEPVLASSDRRVIATVLEAIGRLGEACAVEEATESPPKLDGLRLLAFEETDESPA